jgi:hypothetical protein
MKAYEELARLKVNEAIQRGLEAQRHRREAVAVVSPDLTAWTASPMGSGPQAATVVGGRKGQVRRLLEADWARLATIWLVARAWLGER